LEGNDGFLDRKKILGFLTSNCDGLANFSSFSPASVIFNKRFFSDFCEKVSFKEINNYTDVLKNKFYCNSVNGFKYYTFVNSMGMKGRIEMTLSTNFYQRF
jgi:hypothetical protein